MCLLDLVEENHGIRPAPHSLGELSALLVTHVTGRGPEHARDGVLLRVLGHVEAHHGALVIEQDLRQRARGLGLANTSRAKENEAPDGPIGILQSRARPTHSVGDR